jgi:hypothetical protein
LLPNKLNKMADEIIDNQPTHEGESRSQERIKQLSDKVELTSKERDELKTLHEQAQKKIAELGRENDFSSGFADILGIHPAARDHKDAIKEKVLAGYSVEDATFAVLGKAGKLGATSEPTAQQVAGGSATTTPKTGKKEIKDMTQEERRNILANELGWE